MAGQLGAQKGGFSDINMTPLIDIVLVVLIIMMVSIPVTIEQMGLKLPGPKLENITPPPPNPDQLMIALYTDGTMALNRKLMSDPQMFEQLTLRLRPMENKNVFIDAAPEVVYGRVVDAMDLAREAGAAKIGFASMKDAGPQEATSVMEGTLVKGCKLGGPTLVPNEVENAPPITSLDAVKVDAIFAPTRGQLEACFDAGLARKPAMNGRVLLHVDIGPRGELLGHDTKQSTLEEPETEACMDAVLATLRFPAIGDQRTMAIQVPLLCSPG